MLFPSAQASVLCHRRIRYELKSSHKESEQIESRAREMEDGGQAESESQSCESIRRFAQEGVFRVSATRETKPKYVPSIIRLILFRSILLTN